MNCNLIATGRIDGNRHEYKCSTCSREKWSIYPPKHISLIHRPCQVQSRDGLVRRLSQWEKSVRRWKSAGKPNRTDREVAELLAICKACQHFNPKGKCNLCGCYINIGKNARFNKLRMATEGCPDAPPRWTAAVATEDDDAD